jgi:DegV family protein with EDD domain
VVVDSTADIPQQMRAELGISVVPLTILFGNQSFSDGVDMTSDQFYARLVESNVHPSSSQPSPGAFAEVYEQLSKDHEGIISIHLGGKLSGTVRSAEQAKELVPNVPISIVDTGSVSMGVGFLGLEAAKLARAGRVWKKLPRGLSDGSAHSALGSAGYTQVFGARWAHWAHACLLGNTA